MTCVCEEIGVEGMARIEQNTGQVAAGLRDARDLFFQWEMVNERPSVTTLYMLCSRERPSLWLELFHLLPAGHSTEVTVLIFTPGRVPSAPW
ncbi:hypothetical protein ACOMHN_022529 [Nucella lapillus]